MHEYSFWASAQHESAHALFAWDSGFEVLRVEISASAGRTEMRFPFNCALVNSNLLKDCYGRRALQRVCAEFLIGCLQTQETFEGSGDAEALERWKRVIIKTGGHAEWKRMLYESDERAHNWLIVNQKPIAILSHHLCQKDGILRAGTFASLARRFYGKPNEQARRDNVRWKLGRRCPKTFEQERLEKEDQAFWESYRKKPGQRVSHQTPDPRPGHHDWRLVPIASAW